jgi:hypothetical protein
VSQVSHLVAALHHHERGLREATAEAKLAQLLATPVTPNYLTVDDSYRPVALPSVSATDGPAGRAFRGENGSPAVRGW